MKCVEAGKQVNNDSQPTEVEIEQLRSVSVMAVLSNVRLIMVVVTSNPTKTAWRC